MDRIDLDELDRVAADYDRRKEAARTFEIENFGSTTEERARYLAALQYGEATKAFEALRPLIALVRELERQRDNLAEYMETMCRYCDRDGHCPIFNYCPAPNLLKSCGDMKKADWIQAAEEAGE